MGARKSRYAAPSCALCGVEVGHHLSLPTWTARDAHGNTKAALHRRCFLQTVERLKRERRILERREKRQAVKAALAAEAKNQRELFR